MTGDRTADLRGAVGRWRQVFEHNPVMCFMVDPAGTVLNVNTFGAAQLGYGSRGDGQSVLNVFFEGRPRPRSAMRSVVLAKPWTSRIHGRSARSGRTATVLWVRENAKAMLRGGGVADVAGRIENITQRQEAEDALHTSEIYLAEAQGSEPHRQLRLEPRDRRDRLVEGRFRIFNVTLAVKPTLSLFSSASIGRSRCGPQDPR